MSIAASTGLLTAAGNLILLLILGVDYPVLWAFILGLIGTILAIPMTIAVKSAWEVYVKGESS